jgi:hypothetical protein
MARPKPELRPCGIALGYATPWDLVSGGSRLRRASLISSIGLSLPLPDLCSCDGCAPYTIPTHACYSSRVNTLEIVAALDVEIARLHQARNLIAQSSSEGRGSRLGAVAQPRESTRRRMLSPEARERIAAAQRKRWAKQKGADRKEDAPKRLPELKTRSTKKSLAKSATKAVEVTRLPAKTRAKRRPRSVKTTPAANALSPRAGVVAVSSPEAIRLEGFQQLGTH